MQYKEEGCPKSRWELTAPESGVLVSGPRTDLLLSGPRTDGVWHLELALMELVVSNRLSLVEVRDRGPFPWKQRVALLGPGPEHRAPGGRSLVALLELFDETPPRTTRGGKTGVPVAGLVRKALRKYGWLGGYVETEVMPGLVSRGLYEQRRERRRFSKPQWRLTRAGEDARAKLGRALALGEERFGSWADEDPARALAFLEGVGSSFLLMGEIRPDIKRLHKQLRVEGDTHTGTNSHLSADGGSDRDDPGWKDDFLGLDLDAFGVDLGAFYGRGSILGGMATGVSGGGRGA